MRIASILILAAFVVCGCNRAPRKPSTSESTKAEPKVVVVLDGDSGAMSIDDKHDLPKPDVSLEAGAWRAEFKSGPKAAWEKYKGKVVELVGAVDAIVDGPDGVEGIVSLKADGADGVQCHVPDRPWTRTAVGSRVKVRGKVLDTDEGEALFGVQLVDPGPAPTVLNSADLAKRFASDPDAARQAFHNKRMNIEGEIVEVDARPDQAGTSFYILSLKGDSGVAVKAGVSAKPGTRAPIESAKPGQRAKLFGTLVMPEDPASKEIKLVSTAVTELK